MVADGPGFSWRHILYRLWGADDVLLYIGRTGNLDDRFSAHAKKQPWWPAVARSTIEFLPDLEALIAAEREAILAERPKYNIIHNGAVVAPEDEADWREPWIEISVRVTAGADYLHEECRQHRAANYPEEGYQPTAPCGSCFRESIEFLEAVDTAVGYHDEARALAADVFRHANWLEAKKRVAEQGPNDICLSLPPGPCGCRPCLTPVTYRAREATANTTRSTQTCLGCFERCQP